jgi:hypothetical protein
MRPWRAIVENLNLRVCGLLSQYLGVYLYY